DSRAAGRLHARTRPGVRVPARSAVVIPTRVGYAERAAFYEHEYDETGDHAFITRMARSARRVLEVPCASGRNTMVLGDLDIDLVAADREPAMIERLSERLRHRPHRARVELEVGDMRSLRLGRTFDLILVQREAFQSLVEPGDARRALESLAAHLADGGTLLLDLAAFDSTEGARALHPAYFDA